MGEKNWYRPTFLTLVVLGVVLIFTGASLTEPGTEELAYGRSGSFYIEVTTLTCPLSFTDDEDATAAFDLTVDRRDGSTTSKPLRKRVATVGPRRTATSFDFTTSPRCDTASAPAIRSPSSRCKATLTPTWRITPRATPSLTSVRACVA